MSTLWQLVGFYLSMPCSQNLCKTVQTHYHPHGTYLALIPLMNFNMGALTWNQFFLPNVGFRESNDFVNQNLATVQIYHSKHRTRQCSELCFVTFKRVRHFGLLDYPDRAGFTMSLNLG